ncbi:MAG: PASTA domain-containing protein [Clostridiales bacterium]|nr:PASTA domain-containing protein [Candidatus Cacconaster stercorequi]
MSKRRLFHFITVLCLMAVLLPAFVTPVHAAAACKAPVISIAHNTGSYPGKPRLTWDAVKDAEEYEIWRADGKGDPYELQYTTDKCSTTNVSTVVGNTYYYKIVAVTADGSRSADSNIVHITVGCDAPLVKAEYSSDHKPRLTWEALDGAEEYEIRRANSKDGTYKLLYTTDGCAFTNRSAAGGTTYYYKVVAVTAGGIKTESDPVRVTTRCSAPVVTAARNAANYPGKPRLTWDAVKGAQEYRVYRADSKGGTYQLKFTTDTCAYTNIGAVVGHTYYYKVVAVGADGVKGAASNIVHITTGCSAPKLSYKLVNGTYNGEVYRQKPRITWSAVDGAASYKLYRSSDRDSGYKALTGTKNTHITNTTARSGRTYYYKLAAVSKAGICTYSKPIKVVVKCAQPEVTVKLINGISDSKPYVGKPVVSWLVVDGAKSYQVYRAASKNGTYKLLTTTSRTYFKNIDASSGKTYYYKVKAIGTDSAANSSFSSVKSVTTSRKTPSYNVPYYTYTIKVNYQTNTATVYTYDEDGNYTVPVKAMICSTGVDTPLSGTYSLAYTGKWEWLRMGDDDYVYGHYTTQITGDILFHSVPYLERGNRNSIEYWAYDYLGYAVSAGCVRLQVKDALWIYNHKSDIRSVKFYSSSNPGPLGQPVAPKISWNERCRGWDPTDPNSSNPWRNVTITVGDYVGMTKADAMQAAGEAGFIVGEIAYKHSAKPKGTVIAQSRASGSTASMSAGLRLTVSAGS